MAPVVLALQRDQDNFITRVVVTAQHREMLDQVLACFGICRTMISISCNRNNRSLITVRALAGLEGVCRRNSPTCVGAW